MQVILETTSGLERRMRVCMPSEMLESKVEAKIKQAAGQIQLKGFRKGKVPLREVKRRFGASIRQEVGDEMIRDAFIEATHQEAISAASVPQIEDISTAAGKDFAFTATFEVFPEISQLTFDNILVERPVATILDEDIERVIDTLRDQQAKFKTVERACVHADKVNISSEDLLNGVLLDVEKTQVKDVVLGSGIMIPGFEDGILGMSAGEKREIKVILPQEATEDLAGKEVGFKIKLNSVSEFVRPALDDAFFENFGISEGGLEAFKNAVKANMEKELQMAIKTKVKNQIMDGLLEHNTIDLPKDLIDKEAERLRSTEGRWSGGANKTAPAAPPAKLFAVPAARSVKLGLLVNAIIKQESLVAGGDKVRQRLHNMAASYNNPEEIINYYYSDNQRLNQVEYLVLEDQVIDIILATAAVTDVIQSYEDALTLEPQIASNETPDATPEISADGMETVSTNG